MRPVRKSDWIFEKANMYTEILQLSFRQKASLTLQLDVCERPAYKHSTTIGACLLPVYLWANVALLAKNVALVAS